MIETGKLEKELAIAEGDIENGVPFISVIVDGGWSHRSMGFRFSSKNGVAVIIGARTKKLLYLGIRSKYCCICAMKEAVGDKRVSSHKCFKNWEGSSAAMEADILIEGFNKSVDMHGIEYRTLIGDGDSSVHKKLQENVPYGAKIRKSECANHVARNNRSKLYSLAKVHKGVLTKSRILRMGKGARAAIAHVAKEIKEDLNKDTGTVGTYSGTNFNLVTLHKKYAERLRKDIRNIPHHHKFIHINHEYTAALGLVASRGRLGGA